MATRPLSSEAAAALTATQPDLNVTFVDHMSPRATAGTYTVTLEQRLSDGVNPIDGSDPLPPVEHDFEIRAAQFVLDGATVQAVYPARAADGDFRLVLPHITLTKEYLPWEREPKWSRLADKRAPWLALLVFRAGELPGDPEGIALTEQLTVRELIAADDPTVLGPCLTDLPETTLDGQCRSIDVPAALFTAILPTEEELYYLAHVRDVAEPMLLADGEVLEKGTFSVVTANRFPRAAGDYAVHLVSLEGFDRHLDGSLPKCTKTVRLCSLWSWSFRNDPDAAFDAKGILNNLVRPSKEDPEELALRMPRPSAAPKTPAPDEQYALDRLHLGYVPVPHRLITGEQSYAWYRGPFIPLTAQPAPGIGTDTPRTTADHALIYDQDYGVFDVSYAAAWTLGRAIAIADPSYATEMTRARRELANTATRLMATAADPTRSQAAAADPDGRPGLTALARLARDRGGRSLVDALHAPQLPQVPAARTATEPPRLSRAAARAALAAEPRQAALLATASRRADGLSERLDELGKLRLVPFSYLVPDFRMLPPESLRLFRVDPTWIEALLAGARDVATSTTLDVACDQALRRATGTARRGTCPQAGLLLRSDLVPAWPQMRIAATQDGRALTEVRRDHPAPDMVLCLFDGVPDEVMIREPSEGIHFGIDTTLDDREVIGLRQLTAGTTPPLGATLPGQYFPAGTDTVFSRYLRPAHGDGPADVLRLRGEDGLARQLAAAFPPLTDLHPAQFALELVNAPIEQRLTPAGSTRREPADRSA
ncbi:hypothetical protein ACF07T_39680 [Streptomyces sp. NPDC015184]|uniref:hypothetical protein n=1 Tax=Streptomyces sp. NPDC015184 TaxID=3364946 RepID=UPI0036FE0E9A